MNLCFDIRYTAVSISEVGSISVGGLSSSGGSSSDVGLIADVGSGSAAGQCNQIF